MFCGACNVEGLITADRIIINDKHEYLIACLKAIQRGWKPPTTVSEDDYKYIRAHKDDCKPLAGFTLFACSFGGMWNKSYARDGRDDRNFADAGARKILRTMNNLKQAEIHNLDYRDVPIPKDAVIYCDPPYANTYGYTVGKFDSPAFWEYARKLSKTHIVFISEENAPDDFVCVWKHLSIRSIDQIHDNENKRVYERLYIHKCNEDKITKQLTLF